MYQLSRLTCRTVKDLEASRHEPSRSAIQYLGHIDYGRYAEVVKLYEGWKGSDKVDFVDMLERVLTERIELPPWKAVFIDESQDLSALQFAVVDKLSANADLAFYAGDDWQCLPGDEQILTPTGQRPIRDVSPGDTVIAGVKSGQTGEFKVLRKIEKEYCGEILEMEVESGEKVRVTPEHKVFVHWDTKGRVPAERSDLVSVYPLEFLKSAPMVEFQGGGVAEHFGDLSEATDWISRSGVEALVVEKWSFLPGKSAYRVEARNVLPDVCMLPVVRDGKTTLERVKRVTRVPYSGRVYDLEVEKAHNFCANGILVSNCIMSFQGSSASNFLSYRNKSKKLHLPVTHRFGKRIIELGQRIVSSLADSERKNIRPSKDVHNPIKKIWEVDYKEMPPGKKFFLHRHKEGCSSIARDLIMEGIPFWAERGVNPLASGGEIAGYKSISRFLRGEELFGSDVQDLVNVIRHTKEVRGSRMTLLKRGAKTTLEKMKPNEKISPMELRTHFTDFLYNGLMTGQWGLTDIRFGSYYKALDEAGWELGGDKEPEITITTIHGSKGRDAESVYLWDETLPKCLRDPGEARVAYVGATRTKGSLFLVTAPATNWKTTRYPYPLNGLEE